MIGDTIDCTVDLGFYIYTKLRFRLYGIDAPEMKGETLKQGRISANYLKQRILNKQVILTTYKADSFGRWIAVVFLDGTDINTEMKVNGYAKSYEK